MSDGITSVDEFTSRYGFGPQEYFNRVVKNDANPTQLASAQKSLVLAKATMDNTAGWESLQASDPRFYAGADAENKYTYFKQIVDGLLWRQPFAQQFLAGTLADYGPYLGTEGQNLKSLGWIDTTVVPS